MRKFIICVLVSFVFIQTKAQSCQELIDFVKSESSYYNTTVYNSPTSDAISKVSFHNIQIDYQTYYFAIVCFKREYSYGCDEYIYRVGSNTKLNYSMNYINSAGKAFWNYIQPYHENSECSPDLS